MFSKHIRLRQIIIYIIILMVLINLSPLKAEAAENSRISSQLFSSDHSLTGINNTFYEYFSTGNWKIDGLQLKLVLSTTQLLSRYDAEFTVSVNNEPVYSEALKATESGRYTIDIDCPASCVIPDSTNSVSFNVYLRTSSEDACGDDQSGSNWINFYKESSMNITYSSLNKCDTVSSVYDQISSIDALENNESAILVNGTSDEILSSAARSTGALCQNAVIDGTNLKMLFYDKKLLAKYKSVLVFSVFSELPSELRAEFSESDISKAEEGAIAKVINYEDCHILLITGSKDESIRSAGFMLSNSTYMKQLTGTSAKIKSTSIYTTELPEFNEYIYLSDNGTYVKGYYHNSTDFYIDWSSNRQLAESSELSMTIRYSDNIDYDRSLVTVYINSTPIGSKRLTEDEADNCAVNFDIPADVAIDGKFTVSVAFDLEPAEEDWCHTDSENAPWAFIAPDSMLKLTTKDRTDLSYKSYPAPFIRDGIYNNLMIVLPEAPGEADIKALGMISGTLGKFINGNNGTLNVTTRSNTDAMTNYNVIFIGNGQKNQFLAEYSNLLSIGYNPLNSTFVSNKTCTLSPEYGSLIGVCQLLKSPFSAEDQQHAVMVVTGADNNALLRAAEFVGNYDKLYLLTGDTFIADDDNAYCYTFIDQKDQNLNTNLDTTQKQNVINIILVTALVLILCGIALSLLIYKYRRNGGSK